MATILQEYDARFYDSVDATSSRSARVVVPLAVELISPKSVVDVGCGRGGWLAEFAAQGVSTLLGLDSHHVDQSNLAIDREIFRVMDLSRPFTIDDKYDLAVCLEVAEHLPGRMSRSLIQQLTNAAPVVLFSAGVPGQGGTHHINEQWHWYWHERFAERDYKCYDVIRPAIFSRAEVAWWFRQNVFIYAAQGSRAANVLEIAAASTPSGLIPVASHVMCEYMTVRGLLKNLRLAIVRGLKNKFERID